METKPIVTCHGDQSLFSSLHSTLLKGLPQEPSEWRRSYSRAPKTVYLEASFVPYDEDILPKETDKTLVSRPYFHIFWTSCDLDTYKQLTKEELTEWITALKNQNIPDWLIVVVVTDESKLKSKLLPRSSVIDKVKSDFCSKQPDRCIVVTDPLKHDQKRNDSWLAFLQRLRSLLLQAFNKHLSKYEDNMRSLREKRNELGWKFNNFFLVQEELAFMFEMLGLYEDALIQYDELDALFTQYVLTHAAGSSVSWMSKFTKECDTWSGLSLWKPINHDLRDLIKRNNDGLMDLRNYLFSRQCALLFLLKKPLEVARRALEFLHNTLMEVRNLKIKMPKGSIDCWVFLSCLEVLRKCEQFSQKDRIKSYSLHTASLWDYARRKLNSLGELCGLQPEPDSQPTSEQLTLVLDLIAGMKTTDDEDEEKDQTNKKPREKLREALSSKEAFKKTYLELSELAMGTFKHISRFRCARLIGKDLAEFYIRLGEPEKAENFLMDAMKSFHQEGWHHLADSTKLELAKCQKLLGNKLKYVKTACQVVSSTTLSEQTRKAYHTEILDIAKECSDCTYVLKAYPMFIVEDIKIPKRSMLSDQMVNIDLYVKCDIPFQVHCDSVCLSVKQHTIDTRSLSGKKLLCKTDSGGILKEQVPNFNPVRQPVPSHIEVRAYNEPSFCGLVCVNTQDILRRTDSVKSQRRESAQIKDDYSTGLTLQDVILTPGSNILHLSMKVEKTGGFKPSQLLIKVGGLDFIKTLETEEYFHVINEQPVCQVTPKSGECLLSGITQEVCLSINPGSFLLEPGDEVKLETSQDLHIITGSEGNTLIVSQVETDQSVKFDVQIFQERENTMTAEAQLIVMCSRFPLPVKTNLSFSSPFWVQHKILTTGVRKYIQIILDGSTKDKFVLTDPCLRCDNPDVELLLMNKPGQHLSVNVYQTVSYLWQMKCNTPDVDCLKIVFSAQYSSELDIQKTPHKLSYTRTISDFQTVYVVKVNVTATDNNKPCKVGSMAVMTIQVSQTLDCAGDSSVVYKITEKPDIWAVSGNMTGVADLKNGHSEITVNVMPLMAGFVHVPKVTLYRNTEGIREKSGQDEEDENKTMDGTLTQDRESTYTEFSQGQVYYASSAKQIDVQADS